MGFSGGSDGKESACNPGDVGSIPGSGDPLEKEMATHSSTVAWKIPRTEDPGRPQSMGFSRQEYWSGLPFPSPGDLLTQGLNLGHLHCRRILYH